MEKQKLKVYSTKDIVVGYVTTVNPDSYTEEGQVVKSVIALKKQNHNGTLLPIGKHYPYYSIDKTVPIKQIMKHTSIFITNSEINLLIEHEKMELRRKKETIPTELKIENHQDAGKEPLISIESQEKETNKVKKLVA